MFTLIIIIFVVGYAVIALEHPLHVNKAAPALLTGMLIWTVIMVGHDQLGLTARALWRGPNVLKGRTVVPGVPTDR